MIVNYDEVMRHIEYRRKINTCPIRDIEWVRDDGSKIEVKEEYIHDFEVIGLNNFCFAECFIWNIVNGTEDNLKKNYEKLT